MKIFKTLYFFFIIIVIFYNTISYSMNNENFNDDKTTFTIEWTSLSELKSQKYLFYTYIEEENMSPNEIPYFQHKMASDGKIIIDLCLTINKKPCLIRNRMITKRILGKSGWYFSKNEKLSKGNISEPVWIPRDFCQSSYFYEKDLCHHFIKYDLFNAERILKILESNPDRYKPSGNVFRDFDKEWVKMSYEEKIKWIEERVELFWRRYFYHSGISWKSVNNYIIGIRQYDIYDDYMYEEPLEEYCFLRAISFSDYPFIIFDEIIEGKRCLLIEPLLCKNINTIIAGFHDSLQFDGATKHHLVFHASSKMFLYNLNKKEFSMYEIPIDAPLHYDSSVQVCVLNSDIYVFGSKKGQDYKTENPTYVLMKTTIDEK